MNNARRTSQRISIVSGIVIATATASLALFANAQSTPESPSGTLADVSNTVGLTDTVVTPTVAPLSSALQPITPWPASLDVSDTTLPPAHDLLSYSGVDAQARKLLGADYTRWVSHFNGETKPKMLPQGLLIANGCVAPDCELHKSLLVVSPTDQKVYAAMVTRGRVAMWPSLMSWPDDAIPTLKTWLAAATDDADEESDPSDTTTK